MQRLAALFKKPTRVSGPREQTLIRMLLLPRPLLVLFAINKSEYAFEYLTAVVIGAYLLISSNELRPSGTAKLFYLYSIFKTTA